MKQNLPFMIASIALTAASWGVYGPVLHWGQSAMGGGRLRPFMCVGLAYFVIAVVVPMLMLSLQGWESDEKFKWTLSGTFWSLAAGSAGAIGALGIILAFTNSGGPTSRAAVFVMPLVFGCAPVVNTLFMVTVYSLWGKINPFFAAGLILSASGAVLVLLNAPKPDKQSSGKSSPPPAATASVNPGPASLGSAAPSTSETGPNSAGGSTSSPG